ncbi:MAG: RNA polymerase sigma-70 factor [Gemmatimonadetes bacterium]|nr:RNA polymerase sigma-70 factor [Gemmatimonadota bacterium]
MASPGAGSLSATDRALLERLRAGEHEALHVIFATYHAQLLGFAQSIVHDRSTAEDVVQDVMLELWRRREALHLDTSLGGYLVRSARNRSLNQLRTRRRERPQSAALSHSVPTTAHGELVEREMEDALRAAIAGLPERCREVFELSRVHGLKYAEIATVLHISIKSVETHIGRALRTLRERLKAWLPEADL